MSLRSKCGRLPNCRLPKSPICFLTAWECNPGNNHMLTAYLFRVLQSSNESNFQRTLRKFGQQNPVGMFEQRRSVGGYKGKRQQVGMDIIKSHAATFSPNPAKSDLLMATPSTQSFLEMFPMRNHKVDPSYDKKCVSDFFAQGDNGGMSHNRFQNKGNDILRRKRQSNMRNIGYGISTSVKPKKLHLTYDDY